MTPKDLSDMECSVARTLDVIGDRWSLLILRDAFYGVRRFDDFARDLGVARNILADRLGKLLSKGILEKRQYEERPPRFEYHLTARGKDLIGVVMAMMRWGDRWTSPEDPPVKITHTACGHVTTPVVTCSECGEELHLRDLLADPLPIQGVDPARVLGAAVGK
ncbi:MAG TPA: helix-turn-helix domain-containing protein [Actinomycetota bacterium]|nr:helix-turn-helix domain-containing protein [Actinomycetota bacterium]